MEEQHFFLSSNWLITELTSPLDSGALLILLPGIVLGLIFSAFFSSSEVAFFSLTSPSLATDEEKPTPGLTRAFKMLDKPRRLLSTILIGNTLANVAVSVGAAVLTGKMMSYFSIPESVVYVIEVVLVTFLILILSEITPKIFAIKDPIQIASLFSGLMYVFFLLFSPMAIFLAAVTEKLEVYLPKPSNRFSTDDIKAIAEVGERQGTLEEEEREIIENVIEFSNTSVKEIMTSRVDIKAISTTLSFDEVMEFIKEVNLSRMPLYENDLDTIRGIIHTKDLLPFLKAQEDLEQINWETLARKTLYVPITKKIDDLLEDFQKAKTHVAIVVDEYGGTEGLVTLDDVLEEIVGEMSDEFDDDESLYVQLKNGMYLFDAKIDLDEVDEILEVQLTSEEDDYETLGGLMYHLFERIPEQGERIAFKGLDFVIQEVHKNRVSKVKVKFQPKVEEKQED